MLLRNSISNTKKFFKRTLDHLKTLFSGDSYEKLPKSSPFRNIISPQNSESICINTKEFDRFYSDFTDRWEADHNKKQLGPRRRNTKQMTIEKPKSTIAQQAVNNPSGNSTTKLSKSSTTTGSPLESNCNIYSGKRGTTNISTKEQLEATKLREERTCLVAQKLKELEMMGVSDMDHILDIEEVLHYYSRLTCPSYLEIVDKFFMEIYGEFFNGPPGVGASPASVSSRRVRLVPPVR